MPRGRRNATPGPGSYDLQGMGRWASSVKKSGPKVSRMLLDAPVQRAYPLSLAGNIRWRSSLLVLRAVGTPLGVLVRTHQDQQRTTRGDVSTAFAYSPFIHVSLSARLFNARRPSDGWRWCFRKRPEPTQFQERRQPRSHLLPPSQFVKGRRSILLHGVGTRVRR